MQVAVCLKIYPSQGREKHIIGQNVMAITDIMFYVVREESEKRIWLEG